MVEVAVQLVRLTMSQQDVLLEEGGALWNFIVAELNVKQFGFKPFQENSQNLRVVSGMNT